MVIKPKLFIVHKRTSWGIYYSDDNDLINYLKIFFNIKIINWLKTDIEKLKDAVVLIRYPESYIDEEKKFLTWFLKLQKIAKDVVNPYKIIKQNINKKYLFKIEQQGIRIIPSVIVKRIKDWQKIPWQDMIIKPLIGENSVGVVRLNKKKDFLIFKKYFKNYPNCLVQKFLPGIFKGEISCIFINGKFTHSICKKTPSKTEFKTHWKLFKQYEGKKELINNGIKILKLYKPGINYVRMDWIFDEKKWYLSEIEFIDPVLYITKLDSSAKASFLDKFHSLLKQSYE